MEIKNNKKEVVEKERKFTFQDYVDFYLKDKKG